MSQSPSAVVRGQRVRRWAKKLGVAARGLVNAPVFGGAVEVVGGVIGALEVRSVERYVGISLNYAFFLGSCDHRRERETIVRSNGRLRYSNRLIRSAGGPSDPGVSGVSTIRLNLPNAMVDT
jgi:hypothetical protein